MNHLGTGNGQTNRIINSTSLNVEFPLLRCFSRPVLQLLVCCSLHWEDAVFGWDQVTDLANEEYSAFFTLLSQYVFDDRWFAASSCLFCCILAESKQKALSYTPQWCSSTGSHSCSNITLPPYVTDYAVCFGLWAFSLLLSHHSAKF